MFGLTSRPKEQPSQKPLAKLRSEFESLLDRFLGRAAASSESEQRTEGFNDLDLEERDDEIVVRAELPGFEPAEINTELSGQVLTIRAEKEQSRKNGNDEERTYRFFQESVLLPEQINPDGIAAKYRNGVLEVHVPRTEQSKAKRIPVQA